MIKRGKTSTVLLIALCSSVLFGSLNESWAGLLPLLKRLTAKETTNKLTLPAGFSTKQLSTNSAAYPVEALVWQGLPISYTGFSDSYPSVATQSSFSLSRALYASHALQSKQILQTSFDEESGTSGRVPAMYLSPAKLATYYDCRKLDGQPSRCEDLDFSPAIRGQYSSRSGRAIIKGAGNEITVQRTRASVSQELSSALQDYAVSLPFRMLVAWNVKVGQFNASVGGLDFSSLNVSAFQQNVTEGYIMVNQDRLWSRLSLIPCTLQECEQLIDKMDPKHTGVRSAVLLLELEIVGFAGDRSPWQGSGGALLDAELRRATVYQDALLDKPLHNFAL